jgi:hypothetical protein
MPAKCPLGRRSDSRIETTMLVIREEQVQVLSEYMRKSFEDRTLVHLKRFWPERCEAAGDDAVRQSIRDGIRRARGHGMSSEYDLARFIDLMYGLGMDFDASWAGKYLANEELSPRARLDALYEAIERDSTTIR